MIGVVGATVLATLFALEIKYVTIPSDLIGSLQSTGLNGFESIFNFEGLAIVLSLALVASAETLLCATAVDKMHSGVRTNYSRELVAQGVGNTLCGIFSALPHDRSDRTKFGKCSGRSNYQT